MLFVSLDLDVVVVVGTSCIKVDFRAAAAATPGATVSSWIVFGVGLFLLGSASGDCNCGAVRVVVRVVGVIFVVVFIGVDFCIFCVLVFGVGGVDCFLSAVVRLLVPDGGVIFVVFGLKLLILVLFLLCMFVCRRWSLRRCQLVVSAGWILVLLLLYLLFVSLLLLLFSVCHR